MTDKPDFEVTFDIQIEGKLTTIRKETLRLRLIDWLTGSMAKPSMRGIERVCLITSHRGNARKDVLEREERVVHSGSKVLEGVEDA